MVEPSGMGKLDTNDTSYRPPNTSHLAMYASICMYIYTYTPPAAPFCTAECRLETCQNSGPAEIHAWNLTLARLVPASRHI